ncbi:MAG: GspH/FimT family pseudopilin [Gemmatimonadetes bacterium]|nr:GspH/FimT family pseudopilin [Gemmatimonadota bacterium]
MHRTHTCIDTDPAPIRHPPPSRRGLTLPELLLTLGLLGVLASLAVPAGVRLLQAVSVEMVTAEVTALFARARDVAVARSTRVAVRIDAAAQRVAVHSGTDTLAIADFTDTGVTLETTRDSMAYGPSGLGHGAANLRLTLTRGSTADTITVSRLGRVAR